MKLQKTTLMKINFIVLFIFIYCFGFAQSHIASIENVQKDGFNKIQISAEVRSASRENLDFFRILDKNNKEVPYVVFDNTNRNFQRYRELKILRKTILKDSITSIEIPFNYPTQKYSEDIGLHISNTTLNKTCTVSGSDNQIEWFGLVDNQLLTNLNNEKGTSVKKIIHLPSNNYKFLKIDFNDKNSLPINIIDVGYFNGEQKVIDTSILNDFKYKIKEDLKKKKTIITFSSDIFQKVDGISLATATQLFSRSAKVFVTKTRNVKRQTESYQQEISSFQLNSNTSNTFKFNSFFVKEFTIEIENQDNQPLEISKIDLLQENLYVIADLKSNEKYEVIIDSTFTKPQYDLANFIDSSKDYPKAKISKLTKIKSKKENSSEKPFWQSKAFMWICILFGIAITGYFAIGLLKDLKEKQ
jgi:hypothetical protein